MRERQSYTRRAIERPARGLRGAGSPYDSVGTALLWTLERGLGPAFTDEVRDAWTEAYLLLSSVLRRATARASQPLGYTRWS